jgi:sRNA-binding carbon storage regulator CsrA
MTSGSCVDHRHLSGVGWVNLAGFVAAGDSRGILYLRCGADATGVVKARTLGRRITPQSKESGMLVLTQKEGEILQVGKDVRIFIKRIKGNWVRLCIDAPKEVELKRIPAPKVDDEDAAPISAAPGYA